jgi:hypothetical protein
MKCTVVVSEPLIKTGSMGVTMHVVKPDHHLYSKTTRSCPKSGISTSIKRPPPFKDHFFLAQTWSLKAGFTKIERRVGMLVVIIEEVGLCGQNF